MPGLDFRKHMKDSVKAWLETDEGRDHEHRDLVALIPDVGDMLVRLVAEPRVRWEDKSRLGLALAYIASPVDLVPEGIWGGVGYLDDLVAMCMAIRPLLDTDHADVVRKHWRGQGDVLLALNKTLRSAEEAIGRPAVVKLWRHLMPEQPLPAFVSK